MDVVKATQKHLHDYKKALTAMTATETALSECWASVFDTGSSMYQSYAKNVVYMGVMEQLRIQVDEDLLRDMDEPLDLFMEQFKQLKKRDAERTRRKVDSDRLLYDYEKLQRAGSKQTEEEEEQFIFVIFVFIFSVQERTWKRLSRSDCRVKECSFITSDLTMS